MPPLPCLVLPHDVADGPANMARDEALLQLVQDEAASGREVAALRTYGWAVPTLSLGYFQPIAAVESDPRWRGVPVVRRPTGGGAIWHDREVTYALAVPRGHPLARRSADLYRAVHEAIAGLLRERGVDALRRGDAPAGEAARPFLCFADRDPNDVVIGPHKVVGSAQRRRHGAVLQHGSVLLGRSPAAPELPGVNDLTGLALDPAGWSEALRRRIPEALGFAARPAAWPERFLGPALDFGRSVYDSPAWTRRR
jgi:lipoate-protein ligase A